MVLLGRGGTMTVYYVSQKTGSDLNDGSKEKPFKTINKAAQLALAGDEVHIHEGIYRECVAPRFGGKSQHERIKYMGVPNERVIICGSEHITNWHKVEIEGAVNPIYKTVLENSAFGSYNPFDTKLFGDWLMDPYPSHLHTADVYLDEKSMYEAASLDELKNPQIREEGPCSPWCGPSEKIPHPEDTKLLWFAEVDHAANTTTIYANFGDIDISKHHIEVSVRESCFAPSQVNTNYIELCHLEFCNAATQWAPPTGVQRGMVDVYWSKGWFIHHCHLHHTKTSAISIGKEISTGDNENSRFRDKPGYQMQLEAVFKALKRGWSKELIGSHEICHNVMHDCGQNGVVGHLGCIFSNIHHNHIYNIAMKHDFFGHEIAGIKLHAAIDVQIHHNEFHDCTLGTWLDWEAQGTRVSHNVYYDNYRDIMIEVTHGPCTVDHNIFASKYNFDNVAQGTALIHNIFAGTTRRVEVLNRATPYHEAHSTDVKGYAFVYSGDDRVYGNIFNGDVTHNLPEDLHLCGTAHYDECSSDYESYKKQVWDVMPGDVEDMSKVKDTVYINYNAYLNNAPSCKHETHKVLSSIDPKIKVERKKEGLFITMDLPKDVVEHSFPTISTRDLGHTRISEGCFEKPDGAPIVFDMDLLDHKRAPKESHLGPIDALKEGLNSYRIWD